MYRKWKRRWKARRREALRFLQWFGKQRCRRKPTRRRPTKRMTDLWEVSWEICWYKIGYSPILLKRYPHCGFRSFSFVPFRIYLAMNLNCWRRRIFPRDFLWPGRMHRLALSWPPVKCTALMWRITARQCLSTSVRTVSWVNTSAIAWHSFRQNRKFKAAPRCYALRSIGTIDMQHRRSTTMCAESLAVWRRMSWQLWRRPSRHMPLKFLRRLRGWKRHIGKSSSFAGCMQARLCAVKAMHCRLWLRLPSQRMLFQSLCMRLRKMIWIRKSTSWSTP